MIEVEQTKTEDPFEFSVTIREGSGETHHRVTMSQATYESLTGGRVTPDSCVRAAFKFLLDREPKESILSTFDMTIISRYFPSFEQDFSGYW
ncbi:hypothetical protein MYX82_13020 [Acidobacteria bacterium AH-259-D05]|nr:hypothetical protein [Acidobacteria bacterium AH-259-D05]